MNGRSTGFIGGLLLLLAGMLPAAEIVKYPGIEIDIDKKEVRVEAELSAELMWGEPVLEFLMMRGGERAYETLFLTKTEPMHLQLGLIMLGMKPRPLDGTDAVAAEFSRVNKHPLTDEQVAARADERKAQDAKPAGPCLVKVFVAWKTTAGEKTSPLEKFLKNRRVNGPALPMPLLFNGSYFYNNDEGKNTFGASSSGIFISMLQNPVALFNLPYAENSPYADEPSGFSVKVDQLPSELTTGYKMEVADNDGKVHMVERIVPKAAPVTVIFRPCDTPYEEAAKDPYAASAKPQE